MLHEVILQRHEVAGLLEPETQLFGHQQKVVVVGGRLLAHFLQSREETLSDVMHPLILHIGEWYVVVQHPAHQESYTYLFDKRSTKSQPLLLGVLLAEPVEHVLEAQLLDDVHEHTECTAHAAHESLPAHVEFLDEEYFQASWWVQAN